MPNPVAVNDLSPISGSLQTSRISYAVETAGKNYGQDYNGTTWYSDIPQNGSQYTIISDNYTANYYVSRSNAEGAYVEGGLPAVDEYSAPVFWLTAGTSSLDIITIVNGLPDRRGQIPFNSGSQALNWVASSSNYFAVGPPYEQIDADNLQIYLNASQVISYPTTGSTWYDLSGYSNNATLINGPSFNSNGWFTFDGADDRGQFSSGIISGSGNFTLSAFVRRAAVNTNPAFILGNYGVGNNGVELYWYNNAIYFYSTGIYVTSPTTHADTRWYHVVGSRIGGTGYIYVNGVLETSGNLNVSVPTTNPLTIGNGYDFTSEALQGDISQVMIYPSKGLSATEVAQNYYGGPIVTDGLVFAVDAGNLVSYPKSGTTAYDLTGSNNGTLINGTGFSNVNDGTWTFDGTDDYIRINRMVADNFSLCIWFQTSVTSSTGTQWYQGQGLLDSEVPGSVNDFGLAYLNNKAVFGTGATDTTIQGTTSLNDGVWRYIVATRNKTTGAISLYVNGTLEASGTGNTNSLNAATYIYIGSSNGGVGTYGSINGNVALAQIYNKVLTADEVLQNYNATK
jgi:hypothetical protein